MQPAFIEWNKLTSKNKIYLNDLLPIIFSTRPVFSGVYGKIDHVLNGTDHRALKKRSGSGPHGIGASSPYGIEDRRRRGPGIVAMRDRGADGGSPKNQSSISHRPCQSTRPSLNFFSHLKWPFGKLPRTCIFASRFDRRVMPPDVP
jgi:hypothetical protein